MVMATRSGFDGAASFPVCAAAAAGNGDGNSVTRLVLASVALALGATVGGNSGTAAGGARGSSAGATAVAILAEKVLPPSKRFQSGGAGERFQMFAGDSSSTPT